MENNFNEITDPKTRHKMEEIQGYVNDLSEKIIQIENSATVSTAAAEAAKLLAEKLNTEKLTIQKQIDDGTMTMEEGKIRISQSQRCIDSIHNQRAIWATEAVTKRNSIIGVRESCEVGQQRFNSLNARWKRQQEMEKDMDEYRAMKKEGKKKKPVRKKSAKKRRPISQKRGK
jgi:hypothetical protein